MSESAKNAETRAEMVRALLEVPQGQLLECRDKNGNTALHAAALQGLHGCCEVLLSRSVGPITATSPIRVRNNWGRTAWLLAKGRGHMQCLDVLVKYGSETHENEDIQGGYKFAR